MNNSWFIISFLNEAIICFIMFYLCCKIMPYMNSFCDWNLNRIIIQNIVFFFFLGIFLLCFFYYIFFEFIIFNSHLLKVDELDWIVKIIIYILSFFVFLSFSFYRIKVYKRIFEFLFLILISILGMFFIISAQDFFFLYLAIELMSMPLYILVASSKSVISLESSVKYYVLGSIISVFMLLGISLFYGFFGTTNYLEIKDLLIICPDDSWLDLLTVHISFWFIMSGFFFKLGLAPFHFWIGDVYEGSSLFVVYFISIIPKLPIFIAFIKLFFYILKELTLNSFYIPIFCIYIAIISIIVGSWGGLKQITILRLLGQSSIVNMGFFFLSLIIGELEICMIFLYIFLIYSLILIQFFSILLIFKPKIKNIVSLMSFFKGSKLFFIITIFCILSLAGIPPLGGFLSKFLIFDNLMSLNYIFLVFFLILHSLVSACFYFKLFYYLWIEIDGIVGYFLKENFIGEIFLLIIIFFFNFFLIFFQEPLLTFLLQIVII